MMSLEAVLLLALLHFCAAETDLYSNLCGKGTVARDSTGYGIYCNKNNSTCSGDGSYCQPHRFFSICCCEYPAATCPGCQVPYTCEQDVCSTATCAAHPDAKCIVDHCTSCNPRFILGKEDVTSSCNLPMECDGVQLGDSCVEESCVVLKQKELTLCERLGGKCITSKRGRTNVKCVGMIKEEEEEEEEEEDNDDDKNDNDDVQDPEILFDDKIIPLLDEHKRLRRYWRYRSSTYRGGGYNNDDYDDVDDVDDVDDSDQSQSNGADGSWSTNNGTQTTDDGSQTTDDHEVFNEENKDYYENYCNYYYEGFTGENRDHYKYEDDHYRGHKRHVDESRDNPGMDANNEVATTANKEYQPRGRSPVKKSLETRRTTRIRAVIHTGGTPALSGATRSERVIRSRDSTRSFSSSNSRSRGHSYHRYHF